MKPQSARNRIASGQLLKRLIWLYFWLLIVEGALRRWILPGLAGPLLLVREPVAIAILGLAVAGGALRPRFSLILGIVCGLLSFVLTLGFGHGNLPVAAYGLRIFLLHFPLLYVIGDVFDRDDVWKMARAICWVALPMTALTAAQFFLPQSHWINIGIGGEGTAGFEGAADRFRPPGTFSFTSGLSQFYALAAAAIAALAFHPRWASSWWWRASVISLVLAVPLTISRSVLFSLMITGLVFFVVGTGSSKLAKRFAVAAFAFVFLGFIATLIPAFREGMVAFSERWNAANEAEGGVVEGVFLDRFVGGFWGPLSGADQVPWAGLGLGLGTNAGAALATGGRAFLVGEGEWGRLVGEMGPILGLAVIGIRVSIAATLLVGGYRQWRRGDPTALLLGSVGLLWVMQGGWAQPTSLGFCVVAGGLCLAATRVKRGRPRPARKPGLSPSAESIVTEPHPPTSQTLPTP